MFLHFLIFYHGLFYAETIHTKRPNASFSTALANLVICEDSELGDMVHECAFKYLSPLLPDTFSWSHSSLYGAACPSDLLTHLKEPISVTFRVSFLVVWMLCRMSSALTTTKRLKKHFYAPATQWSHFTTMTFLVLYHHGQMQSGVGEIVFTGQLSEKQNKRQKEHNDDKMWMKCS